MPVPPRYAIKTTCKHCGWSTVTHQPSDVIMRPGQCARCGATDPEHTAANVFETAAAEAQTQPKPVGWAGEQPLPGAQKGVRGAVPDAYGLSVFVCV